MRESPRLAVPFSIEAESALLGGLIQNPEGLTRVASIDPAAAGNRAGTGMPPPRIKGWFSASLPPGWAQAV